MVGIDGRHHVHIFLQLLPVIAVSIRACRVRVFDQETIRACEVCRICLGLNHYCIAGPDAGSPLLTFTQHEARSVEIRRACMAIQKLFDRPFLLDDRRWSRFTKPREGFHRQLELVIPAIGAASAPEVSHLVRQAVQVFAPR
jgi:hypothetical protein